MAENIGERVGAILETRDPARLEAKAELVRGVLIRYQAGFASIVPADLKKADIHILNLSAGGVEDTGAAGGVIGIGKYNEDRPIYKTALFAGAVEPRTVHLAIDILMPAGTPLFAPLEGTVHSFQDNDKPGDYGPTVILEHALAGVRFYTLYGHLSRESLLCRRKGRPVRKGEAIGKIGVREVNGGWPEHVHFQIITDMLGIRGDFPGVAPRSALRKYLALCPDPNLILRIKASELSGR